MRSCYSSTWRFPETGDREIEGYYFFAEDAAPFYEDWHFFGSRNWHHNDGSPIPPFGEMEEARQTWRNGSFPVRKPDPIRIGTQACLEGESGENPHPPAALIHGVDARCWSPENPPAEITGEGGGKGNSAAELAAGHALAADGGGKGDSAADTSAGHVLDAQGGGKGDSAATLVISLSIIADGGGKGDSAAPLSAGHVLAGDGGGKGDSAATTSVGFALTGSGGGKGDSAAGTQVLTTSCGQCTGGMWRTWSVTVSGMTGNNSSFNGTWSLGHTTSCIFTVTSGATTLTLNYISASSLWILSLANATNSVTYNLAAGSWNCLSGGTLNFASQTGTGSHPATLTVHP